MFFNVVSQKCPDCRPKSPPSPDQPSSMSLFSAENASSRHVRALWSTPREFSKDEQENGHTMILSMPPFH